MAFNPNAEKPIIAITGSAGKTTVKSMASAILRERWVVFESKDYYNTIDKTQLHADQISFIHRAAVLEYGMAFPGFITDHCRIIQPNIGVITNVGLAHIGNFEGKVELLASAKSELIKGMHPSGILVINADDQNSKLLHTAGFTGKIVMVGIESAAQYQAKDIKTSEHGIAFKVTLGDLENTFYIPIVGKHNVYNALFAIAVADQLGFTPIEIGNGLTKMKKPNHRLDIYHLEEGITVIDDTVHANPPAMKAAIDVLIQIGKGKKIAILGSMPELGERTEEYHRELGQYLASNKVDFLITYGQIGVYTGWGAVDAGFPVDQVKHFKSTETQLLHNELIQLIEPGVTILVKGASRLDMYETVRFLRNHYKGE